MLVVSVMYPATPRFDLDCDTRRHMRLVHERRSDMQPVLQLNDPVAL